MISWHNPKVRGNKLLDPDKNFRIAPRVSEVESDGEFHVKEWVKANVELKRGYPVAEQDTPSNESVVNRGDTLPVDGH